MQLSKAVGYKDEPGALQVHAAVGRGGRSMQTCGTVVAGQGNSAVGGTGAWYSSGAGHLCSMWPRGPWLTLVWPLLMWLAENSAPTCLEVGQPQLS